MKTTSSLIRQAAGPLLLLIGASLAGPASSAEDWKIASVVVPPHILATFVDKAAEDITKTTDREVVATRHQMANEQEIVQNIIRGRVAAGYVSTTGLTTVVPEIGVLGIPYLWKSDAERAWVGPRYAAPLVGELLKEKGLYLARYGVAGWNHTFCKFPCTKPGDLKGIKARVSPSQASRLFFEALGSNGVQMPLSEFMVAIQQGVVDAGELTFGSYVTTPLSAAAPHYVTTQHSYAAALFVVNQKALDALPAKTKAAVLTAFPEHDWMDKINEESERVRMMEFNKSGKGHVYFLTDVERAAWIERLSGVQQRLVDGMGGRAQELFNAIKKGQAEYAAQAKR